MRRRTSYPLSSLSQIVEAAVSMYSLPSLPVKWLCSKRERAIKEKNEREMVFFKRATEASKLSSETLTLMNILGLVTERRSLPSDLVALVPGVNLSLKEILRRERNPPEVQKLSRNGLRLAEFSIKDEPEKVRRLLFYLLMKRETNERLPDLFPRIVQTPEILDREVVLLEQHKTEEGAVFQKVSNFAKRLGISKPPEARYLVSWTKYFGINLATSDKSVLLDRRGVVDLLFHAQVIALRELIEKGKLILDGGYVQFSSIRKALEAQLYILPTGLSVDNVFSILEFAENQMATYKLAWMIDRSYVGSPHDGNPKHARILVKGEVPSYFEHRIVEQAADSLLLMR